jgi:signal transduction histidine kinase
MVEREDIGTRSDLGRLRSLKEFQQALALSLSRARGHQAGLIAVMKEVCGAVGWAYAETWLTSRDGRALKPGPAWPSTAAFGDHRARSRKLGFRRGSDLPGRVLSTRRSEWVEDVSAVSRCVYARRTTAAAVGLRAALALPLLSAGRVLGVVVFYAREAHARSADIVEYVTAALSPLGPVLERKRAEETLRARARQQEAVARLGLEALEEGATVASLTARAITVIREMLAVEYGEIFECRQGDVLQRRAGLDEEDDDDDAHARYALRAKEPVLVEDLANEDRFVVPRRLCAHDVASGAFVVIPGHGRAVGVLGAYSIRRRRFTHTELSFLQGVANVLGAAIERRRAERELERHRRNLERTVAERTARLAASRERLCQSERLASIGTLAAGLGHDLQNVLLPVLCHLDALEAADPPADLRAEVEAIRHSLDYLQRVSHSLRLFARDPREAEADDEVTGLAEWWETASPVLGRLPARNVALRVTLPSNLPPVRISADLLSQAVLHLLVNARQAGARSSVRISAETAADNRSVRLGVSDDGEGMSAEVRCHALEPFFTTRQRSRGTGLGLSVVHGIVKAAGGSVDIHSCPGAGTTVVLTLPTVHAPRTPPSDSLDSRKQFASVSVLDRRVSAYVSSLLASAGFRVRATAADAPADSILWVTASECRPAVARYLAEHPDRRVLVLGPPGGSVRRSRVSYAVHSSDLDDVRRSLRATIHAIRETTDAF